MFREWISEYEFGDGVVLTMGAQSAATVVNSRRVMEIKVTRLEGIKEMSPDQSIREAIHIDIYKNMYCIPESC